MHFSYTASLHGAFFRLIPVWVCSEMERYIFTNVFDRSDQSSHVAVSANVQHGFFFPLFVLPTITQSKFIGIYLRKFPVGIVHTQRLQNIFRDVLLIRNSRYARNDVAENGISHIAVFKPLTGCRGEGDAAFEETQ